MSESEPMTHDNQELFLAVGPTKAWSILGVRGVLMRDMAGSLAAKDTPISALTLFLPDIPETPGLWVWAGSVTEGSGSRPRMGWPLGGWKDGAWRAAVVADMQRFGLPPLLPRIPEGSEAVAADASAAS